MLQKDIYDKICDIFDERFKNEKNKTDTKLCARLLQRSWNRYRRDNLTCQLNVAIIDRINEVAIERECYLKKLKNNIADYESGIRRRP